jgi:hypothetical protein
VRPVPYPPPEQDPKGFALVGACNDECMGCEGEPHITNPGQVLTTLVDSGEEVILDDRPPPADYHYYGASNDCRAYVRLGTRIRVAADPGELLFVYWEDHSVDHFVWERSPCSIERSATSEFEVTGRSYCGAVFQRRTR